MMNHPTTLTCESTQLSLSDKLDASLTLNPSELEHIKTCSECAQFQIFLLQDSLKEIAELPASHPFENDHLKEANAIMARISEPSAKKSNKNIISLTAIATGLAATAAVVALNLSTPQPEEQPQNDSLQVQNAQPVFDLATIQDLKLPEIKIDEKYAVINKVVVENIETVSYGIKKLKACFIEGNAFLEEHTSSPEEDSPESFYMLQMNDIRC